MSEQILLLNPRRRRRSNRRRRHNRRRQPRRRHNRRRVVHTRPRRRRHNRRSYGFHFRRRRSNPRRRRHNPRFRRRRHNRRMFGGLGRLSGLGGGVVGRWLVPGAIGGIGALGLDIAWGYVSPHLPAQIQTGWFGALAKSAVAILGVGLLGRALPRQRHALQVAGLGAVTVIAATAIKGAAQGVLPASTPGLSGYIDYQSFALPGAHRMAGYMPRGTLGGLGDVYSPAAVIQPAGTPVPRQFGGYVAVQPHMVGSGGLMGYDWSHDGM